MRVTDRIDRIIICEKKIYEKVFFLVLRMEKRVKILTFTPDIVHDFYESHGGIETHESFSPVNKQEIPYGFFLTLPSRFFLVKF